MSAIGQAGSQCIRFLDARERKFLAQLVQPDIDHRREVERKELRQHQAADHREAERTACFAARARTEAAQRDREQLALHRISSAIVSGEDVEHVLQAIADASLEALAAGAGLRLASYRVLPGDPQAQGPGLFVAVIGR